MSGRDDPAATRAIGSAVVFAVVALLVAIKLYAEGGTARTIAIVLASVTLVALVLRVRAARR